MARITEKEVGSKNILAFLDMLAVSELGERLLSASDDGYNVIVGSTVMNPDLFPTYKDHPRKLVSLPKLGIKSTAAGRYQILARYFDHYREQLGLSNFGPINQDRIALQLIRECKALDDIKAGRFASAVARCKSRWASLPLSPYNQHTNSMESLKRAYIDAGGFIA